jgi:hypothetical protein
VRLLKLSVNGIKWLVAPSSRWLRVSGTRPRRYANDPQGKRKAPTLWLDSV